MQLLLAMMAAMPFADPAVLLGPGDLIHVRVLHVAEIPSTPLRIDDGGALHLPLAGAVPAAGLTPGQLTDRLIHKFKPYVRQPEVTVELADRQSRPVTVLGAVKSPGIQQIRPGHRLLDVLSMAGGLTDDAAGTVVLTRVEAGTDVRREIDTDDLMSGHDPALNFVIRPRDTITAPRGKFVYVAGEVRRPGGFPVRSAQGLSILQAMSLSEGLTPAAAAKTARIVRAAADGSGHTEIPVNIRDILSGKDAGARLMPGDVLFVPNSASKRTATRTIETALQMATGLVIFRRY